MAEDVDAGGKAVLEVDFPASSQEFPSSVFDGDDRVLVGMPETYPWSSIGRVTTSAGGPVLNGTGFMVGPFHMLTAGHVVENALLGGDGRAYSIEVVFASDGSTQPFGTALGTGFRTLDAWSVQGLPEADWALVTLDRSIGNFTGYMGLASQPGLDFYDGASVTLAGFPADLGSGAELYAAAGPIGASSAGQFFYSGTLDTAGGMSGAPIWRTFSATGRREVIGVHTTGAADPTAPGATNTGTRLTADILAQIEEWSDLDSILAPPIDRADFTDGSSAVGVPDASLDTTAVVAGGTVMLTFWVENRGTLAAPPTDVAIYASLNDTITESDILLETVALPGLAPFAVAPVEATVPIPVYLPGGPFRIGWRLDAGGTVTEFDESDNTVLLGETLQVTGAPDLEARGLAVLEQSWTQGATEAVSWEIVNTGGAHAGATLTRLVLSQDPVADPTDLQLGTDPSVASLVPAEVAPVAVNISVPLGIASGVYYLIAAADIADQVAEADEADNLSSAVLVSIGRPGVAFTGDAAANGLVGGADEDTLIGGLGNDTLTGQGGADRLIGDGDDDILNGDGGQDTLTGGPGFDTLRGHDGPDLLVGDLGDPDVGQGDLGFGGSGSDTLRGDGGPDTLYGEAGDDLLEGDGGFDLLNGNDGNDTLIGGALGDTLDGEAGNDSLAGGSGNDNIYGGSGSDTIEAGPGPDFVDAGAGDDLVEGGADDDILIARDGADTTYGGDGLDRVQAGAGDDLVIGGSGNDRLFGEAGADTIEGGPGADLIFGHGENDSLVGGSGDDSLVGEAGADTLVGGSGNDLLAGRDGQDHLVAGFGDDLVDGEAGDDSLEAGEGADTLFGRDGRDTLLAGAGNDFLAGGAGDDWLEGGAGADRLGGDAGADSFVFRPGDGEDLIFDLVLGGDTVLFVGGVQSFGALTFGTGEGGWVSVAWSGLPGDSVTLQGLRAEDLSDDGTFLFA